MQNSPTFSTLPSPLQTNSERGGGGEDIKVGPFDFRPQSQKHSSFSVSELSPPYLGPLANLTQLPLFSIIVNHSFFFLFMSASTQPQPQAFLCKGLESQNLGSVLHCLLPFSFFISSSPSPIHIFFHSFLKTTFTKIQKSFLVQEPYKSSLPGHGVPAPGLAWCPGGSISSFSTIVSLLLCHMSAGPLPTAGTACWSQV